MYFGISARINAGASWTWRQKNCCL